MIFCLNFAPLFIALVSAVVVVVIIVFSVVSAVAVFVVAMQLPAKFISANGQLKGRWDDCSGRLLSSQWWCMC